MIRDNSDVLGWTPAPRPPAKSTASPATGQRIGVALPVLAEMLNLSVRAVTQLCVSGTVIKIDRGEYDAVASVKNYIEKMRRPDGDSKDRLTTAQADLAELKLSQAKGDLVEASQVELEWDKVLRTLRSSFMGIPARVQEQLPHLTAHDVSTIDREIRDALTDIGEDHAND